MIAASTLLLALALTPLPTDALIVVTDPSGARVPGATVTLDQGASRELAQTSTARGEAALLGIEEGEHRVSVSLPGFETWEKTVKIRAGQKPIEVKLRMARVAESVLVAPDNREAGSGGYRTTLTEADLANLPDDPDQLEAALRAMAGPQASMRVNGFSGGRLPPKSQIRQIRFVMNPYAAEFHESQPVFIDIQTKPGLGQWSRTARFGLRDESFNSLSPLARARVPDSYQRFGLDLSGPLIKNKTSLSISAEGRLTDTARIVRATNTAGNLSDLADSSTDRLDLSARLEHGWGKTHTLRAELETLSRNEAGLGIGGLELKERGYTQDRREKTVRITDNGVIFGHVASELRFSAKFDSLDTTSASASPAVRVLGSFTSGGAGFVGGRSGRDLELSSNFDVSAGKKHAMRFGFQLRDQRISSTEQQNAAGTFTFDDLAAYAAQRPSQFTSAPATRTFDTGCSRQASTFRTRPGFRNGLPSEQACVSRVSQRCPAS